MPHFVTEELQLISHDGSEVLGELTAAALSRVFP